MKLALLKALPGSVIGRAAILVPVALALWWFLLKGASLWALRMLAGIPLAILIAPPGLTSIRVDSQTGEWVCNVEVNTVARNQQTGELQHINSVEIAFRESDAAVYASGWFSYLALALSTAPFSRKKAKRALWGLGIQTVINVLCLAGFVYILGHETLSHAQGVSRSVSNDGLWWIKYFDHINTLVIPFAGPFLLAILLHPEWRRYTGFAQASEPSTTPVERSAPTIKAKRRRKESLFKSPR